MRVTPDSRPLDFLKSDLVRSPGLHASDIYNNLFEFLEPKRYAHDGPPNAVLMALGTAWESHLERLLVLSGVQAYRPGELLSPEGIAYSPDLIVFDREGRARVGEIKLTSMALDEIPQGEETTLPPKFAKYLCQLQLYALWLELLYGWLAVCSIRKPYAPEFRAFNIEFTPRELEENWRMVMNHAVAEQLLTM